MLLVGARYLLSVPFPIHSLCQFKLSSIDHRLSFPSKHPFFSLFLPLFFAVQWDALTLLLTHLSCITKRNYSSIFIRITCFFFMPVYCTFGASEALSSIWKWKSKTTFNLIDINWIFIHSFFDFVSLNKTIRSILSFCSYRTRHDEDEHSKSKEIIWYKKNVFILSSHCQFNRKWIEQWNKCSKHGFCFVVYLLLFLLLFKNKVYCIERNNAILSINHKIHSI